MVCALRAERPPALSLVRRRDLLAEAVIKLLADRKVRDGYGAKAYEATRDQVWSATGAAYGRIFARVARPSHRPSPPVRRLSPAGR